MDEYMTVADAARESKLDNSTIRKWIYSGRLRARRDTWTKGGPWEFKRKDFERLRFKKAKGQPVNPEHELTSELFNLTVDMLTSGEPVQYIKGYCDGVASVRDWILAGKLESVKVQDEFPVLNGKSQNKKEKS
jgi:hypothetical protein